MAEAAPSESSMEDILASIRKIIKSDDDKNERAVTSSTSEVKSSTPSAQTSVTNTPVEPTKAPSGSLAALAAQMRDQTPSAPRQAPAPSSTSSLKAADTKPDASPANPAPTSQASSNLQKTDEPVAAEPVNTIPQQVASGSLAALAAKLKVDGNSPVTDEITKLAPNVSTPQVNENRRESDPKSSGESLRELAKRVAASPSQKSDSELKAQDASEKVEKPEEKVEPTSSEPIARAQSSEPAKAVEPKVLEAKAVPVTTSTSVNEFKEALVAPSTQEAVS
ncbi:MAG: hypothetical protein WBC71_05580, partial [Salaquimonas sp.]